LQPSYKIVLITHLSFSEIISTTECNKFKKKYYAPTVKRKKTPSGARW